MCGLTRRSSTGGSKAKAGNLPQAGAPVKKGQRFSEVGLSECLAGKKTKTSRVVAQLLPSHVPSNARTASTVRSISLTAPRYTGKTDCLAEEGRMNFRYPVGRPAGRGEVCGGDSHQGRRCGQGHAEQ